MELKGLTLNQKYLLLYALHGGHEDMHRDEHANDVAELVAKGYLRAKTVYEVTAPAVIAFNNLLLGE